jgi:hypothetical protein
MNIKYETCEWCGQKTATLQSYVRATHSGGGFSHTRRCFKCKKWYCEDCISRRWDAIRENRVIGSSRVQHELALWREGRAEGFFSSRYLDDYCPVCGRHLDGAAPGGCFIATSALGTSNAWQLDVLREFRDQTLLQSAIGKSLVNGYLRWSPRVAKWLETKPRARWFVRTLLVTPVARTIARGRSLDRS